MKYYIYTLTDPIDNLPKYIGKTKNLKDRLQRHLSSSNLNESTLKNNWIKKLKNLNLKPIIEILDEGDENNIDDLEIYWISQFKTWNFKLKNIAEGGNNPNLKGCKLKKEHIDKLKIFSNTRKKEVCQYDILTNKLIATYSSIAEAEKVLKLNHVSDCCKGKRKMCGESYFRFSNNYFPYIERTDYWTGAKHKKESLEKIKMNHPFRKEICQYSIETDELIAEYKSLHEAAQKTNIDRKHISECCRNIKNYNSAGGYYWRFKNNYFPYIIPSNKNIKIIQYDINKIIINEFNSLRETIKNGFIKKYIENSINKNILYKNSYWKIIY